MNKKQNLILLALRFPGFSVKEVTMEDIILSSTLGFFKFYGSDILICQTLSAISTQSILKWQQR